MDQHQAALTAGPPTAGPKATMMALNLLIEVESPSLAKNDGPYGGDEVEGVKVGPPPLVGPMHFATVTL